MAHRPLSPHVFIYRFAYTMALSILHRATGLLLSAGLLLFVWFLHAMAWGGERHAQFTAFAAHVAGRLAIAALLIAFFYHLANGVRHLFWDMSLGMERAQARRSAVFVIVFTAAAAVAVLWFCFRGMVR
jgi:succinate dehydrogenase / fumarate reductase cytochrome b subunit